MNAQDFYEGQGTQGPDACSVLSYRAECQSDVIRFEHFLLAAQIFHRITKFVPDIPTGEVLVEMEYWDVEYEQIESIMNTLPDCHVMYDTVRPVPMEENSMERDINKGT